MKKHIISESEYLATKAMIGKNKHKNVDKRLQVIVQRYEGKSDNEIGEKLGYHRKHVSQLCAEFKKVGLEEFARHKFGGNNQALDNEEEEAILAEFREKAQKGEIVSVQEIKLAFDKRRGKDTGRGYIYMLLERHGWRKIMPRSKHPKKASEEAIDASKKLTLASEN